MALSLGHDSSRRTMPCRACMVRVGASKVRREDTSSSAGKPSNMYAADPRCNKRTENIRYRTCS